MKRKLTKKEKYSLVGVNGNAFSIMGYVRNALKKEGLKDKIKEYTQKATAKDYNHLIAVSLEYIELANKARAPYQ